MSDKDAILAYRAANAVEAHALAAYLANGGIEARVLGESLQGAYAGIRLGGMELPEVWIAGKDRDSAEPLIAAWQADYSPHDAEKKPRRFQFSLALMLLATSYVALWAGSSAMSETTREIFLPLVNILLFTGFAIIAWKKARSRRAEPDHSEHD